MAQDGQDSKPVYKVGRFIGEPGKPLRIEEPTEITERPDESALCRAVSRTLKAYRTAAENLLAEKYASVKELAPPHLRAPCDIYVFCCPDGILVRYDLASGAEPKVRSTDRTEGLSEWAPQLSEQVVHFPADPENYIPASPGPGIVLGICDAQGNFVENTRLHPVIYASRSLPEGFRVPPPPQRPPCIASIHNELQMQLQGVVLAANTPAKAVPPAAERFIAHGVLKLQVGWQAIEVYPLLREEYWKPEYARLWAELDLLAAIAQANQVGTALSKLDGRREARERYAKLLDEFSGLLAGKEEPVHQFLKSHPELICQTHDAMWSKLLFGKNISDFVFREPRNDYLLVEIEAPYHTLFRKDGHPRHELQHAIDQIRDWALYIQDNGAEVEQKGLAGISVTPRELVVIGRSAGLTEENWRALTALQTERPRLTILTYDQLLDRARANIERLLGPLSLKAQGLKLYFFRDQLQPDNWSS